MSAPSNPQRPDRPHRQRRGPRAAVVAALLAVGSTALVVTVTAEGPSNDQLRIEFDSLSDGTRGLTASDGAVVVDQSGHGNDGVVHAMYGGSIVGVGAADTLATAGPAADFPNACKREPCPNALVEIADADSLDPGLADFEWGARLKLGKNETADGENVVQKGTWGQPGGQWKLQVDKAAGVPSCVVAGVWPSDGSMLRVVLKAAVSVADGKWHDVRCRRTAEGVSIVIDSTVQGFMAMPLVDVASDAPVTIGAKSVKPRDNDQFHGVLDDVFLTML